MTCRSMDNLTDARGLVPKSGYDLPVYGLDNGLFYALHIPAVACILTSFLCAVAAAVVSFRRHHARSFFSWTQCDRFIVYMAICDASFNLAHGTDHIHVLIARNHAYPEGLCHLYGFLTTVFPAAQNILVGLIAVNIFVMVYFQKKLRFGRFDCIILLMIYGLPVVGGVVAWCLGYLGPNGSWCLTDGVKGRLVFIMFFTIPLLSILTMNSGLYILTWIKIQKEIKLIRDNMGNDPPSRAASRRAAKSMSLFVAAFFIQWWAAGLQGAWGLCGEIPPAVLHAATIFTNLGGVLNLIVFVLINRKRLHRRTGKHHGITASQSSKSQDSSSDMGSKSRPSSLSTIS